MQRADGTVQFVPTERLTAATARFDADVAYAEKAEEHVWITIVTHRMSDARAKAMATPGNDDPGILDAESVVAVNTGCFRCEKALGPRLVGKRCRGAR